MFKLKSLIFIACILLPLTIGFLGSYFTIASVETWYKTLEQPFLSPPNWVFGPVWTTLYILMGISSFLIIKSGINKKNKNALQLYSLQILVNLLWSLVFFGMHSILGGFLIIVILWVLIFLTIRVFYKINKNAGILLIPYLIWVSFATLLNFFFLILNS
ncbi:MAG: TspO/MBR family protein [Candidatus Levybacteria bacterium]|nr:TspO/MBR family protein [Candidatus Levybacteria bacterium]